MRKAELQNYKKLIAGYYDALDFGEGVGLAKKLELNREAARVPGDNDFMAAMRLVEGGDFAIYHGDVERDLMVVYGDDYKRGVYYTKAGELRVKGGQWYIWTVYKAKMAQAINKIIDGEA